MVIFSKEFKTIEEVNESFKTSCSIVEKEIYNLVVSNNKFERYEDYVEWVLHTCNENLPTPFSTEYPYEFGLHLTPNSFNIRYPRNFGFGIKVIAKKNSFLYIVSVTFYNDKKFVEATNEYKQMVENGWKIVDFKN